MDTDCPEALKKYYNLSTEVEEIEKTIPDAYLYFWSEIENWLKEGEKLIENKLNALRNTINRGIRFVVIDLEENDDPQIIFETLNARGTPLLQSDLVKNLLFYEADKKKFNVEGLYSKFWQNFDDKSDFWREEVKQGRLYRPMIDVFLQYYVLLKTKNDFTSSSLFMEFKNYSKTNKANISPEQHLENIDIYAKIYERFFKKHLNNRINMFFYRLSVLETTTVFPLLLQIYNRIDSIENENEIEQALAIIESFLVRRLVCRLTTKNYNRLFLNVVSKLEKAGNYSSKGIAEILLESDSETDKWPDDIEFKEAWINSKFYFAMSRARARMILEALNNKMVNEKTEAVEIPKKLTIEHIMPQAWQENWPIADSSIEAEINRDSIIHTIGNLTLVTKHFNPAVSNSSWEIKKEELRKHSVINLNRELVNKYNVWEEENISNRSSELFDIAAQIWPRPRIKVKKRKL